MEKLGLIVCITGLIFLLTWRLEKHLIPKLKEKKMGQIVLEEGLERHKAKEGTPTMGGIAFWLPTLILLTALLIFSFLFDFYYRILPFLVVLVFAFVNSAIGICDDLIKLARHKNEGLTRLQKLLLQLVVSVLFLTFTYLGGVFQTDIILCNRVISLSLFAFPIALGFLLVILNGANFTDGLDGLASSVHLVAGIFFLVLYFTKGNLSYAFVGSLLIGLTSGFLVFNHYPAKVFMGDTGSLFLGSLEVGVLLMEREWGAMVLVCLVFILEFLSSAWQTVYAKTHNHKRFFKKAPFHHHLEECHWSENKIVIAFALAEAVFSAIGYFLI